MDQPKNDHPPPVPLPIEPGHVMSPKQYQRLVDAQKQKQK